MVPVAYGGIVRVRADLDRHSWSRLRGRFSASATGIGESPVEAAAAVDARNASTAPWKTAKNAVSHTYHRPLFVTGAPNKRVTHVPG